MQVTVEYAAQVKRAAGQAAETVEVPAGSTVQDVLRRVVELRGEPLRELLFGGDGRLHPSILLFVGDRQVRWDDTTALADRDTLTVLSPISGG
jgi:molybdopterin converting factor small subunit